MALGLASSLCDSILNHFAPNQATWSKPGNVYAQLHTGDPGAAGTTAAANSSARQEITFGASSAGTIANSAPLTWSSVSTTETYTHISLWSAASTGTFYWSGDISPDVAVSAGGNFTIGTGSLQLTFAKAS